MMCPIQHRKTSLIQDVLILSLALILTAVPLSAELLPSLGGQRVATSAYSFLKIDPSVSSSGLGHAGVAKGGDASMIYWNPASLVQFRSMSISLTHSDWFTGIDYDYAALSLPLFQNSSLGLSAGILHMSPMEITTEYRPYGSGEYFTFRDAFASLTLSQKMSDRFSFGLSVKYIEESYVDLESSAVMMDLGTWYYTGYRDLRIAVSLLHFGSPVKPAGQVLKTDLDGNEFYEDYEEFSPPTSFQLGSAMTLYEGSLINLTGYFQLNHPVDNAETYVFAAEAVLLRSLSFRAGYDVTADEAPLSVGLGFHPEAWKRGFSIDYALMEHPWLQTVQQFQINFFLDK